MAVTSRFYGQAFLSAFNAEIDFDTATVKAMLCTSTYSPSQDPHRYKSSVTNEVAGTGYTAGGVTLSSKTLTYDAATNTITFDCADPSWASATFPARYLVVYDNTPATDATRPLICYIDFGSDQSPAGVTFTYTVRDSGMAYLLAA